jgi:hypothetical protein
VKGYLLLGLASNGMVFSKDKGSMRSQELFEYLMRNQCVLRCDWPDKKTVLLSEPNCQALSIAESESWKPRQSGRINENLQESAAETAKNGSASQRELCQKWP